MQPFHAVVKNGRLTLDAPSDLPDGQVVVLLPLEELMSAVEDADDDGELAIGFVPYVPQHEFRKPKAITAASLIDELKSL
ncbi:MAG: hypothetical protein KIT84_40560 [Labilithrix sp.]|nr:hypothetical protein [Labilithrix sp.]MCW5817361.1 hypothetical protein [Labilithrix sp.]